MNPEERRQAIVRLQQQYPDQPIHEFEFDPGNPMSSGIVYVGEPPRWLTLLVKAARIAIAQKKWEKGLERAATEKR